MEEKKPDVWEISEEGLDRIIDKWRKCMKGKVIDYRKFSNGSSKLKTKNSAI